MLGLRKSGVRKHLLLPYDIWGYGNPFAFQVDLVSPHRVLALVTFGCWSVVRTCLINIVSPRQFSNWSRFDYSFMIFHRMSRYSLVTIIWHVFFFLLQYKTHCSCCLFRSASIWLAASFTEVLTSVSVRRATNTHSMTARGTLTVNRWKTNIARKWSEIRTQGQITATTSQLLRFPIDTAPLVLEQTSLWRAEKRHKMSYCL